ncbi:MAG: tetratricopeptide repeat protein, partial [Bacteroidota bacterium]
MSRIQLTLAGLFLSIVCLAQPGEEPPPFIYRIPDEYSKIHQEGEIALLEKKYRQALGSFKKVLKRFPDFPPALRSSGACHELLGEFEEAAKYYAETLKHNPNFSRAMYFECGNIYYKCGKYRRALEYFETFDSLKTLDFKQFTYNGMEEREVEKDYYDKLSGHLRACHVALDSIQYWNIASV